MKAFISKKNSPEWLNASASPAMHAEWAERIYTSRAKIPEADMKCAYSELHRNNIINTYEQDINIKSASKIVYKGRRFLLLKERV